MGFKKLNEPEVADQLSRETPKDALWIFDCDGTLINSDICSHTAWNLLRSGLAHPEQLPEDWHEFSQTPFDFAAFKRLEAKVIERRGTMGFFEWEMMLHTGLPPSTVYQVASLALDEGLNHGSIVFTRTLSKLAQKEKERSWIVSGSPYICVAVIANRLGISPERIIATEMETVDDIYAPRLKPPGVVWEGLKKDQLLRAGIHKPWIVFGDSIGDWAMMELATDWVWCVIWDEHRHRGLQFREHLEEHFSGYPIPREPGLYGIRFQNRNWLVEVKDPNAI